MRGVEAVLWRATSKVAIALAEETLSRPPALPHIVRHCGVGELVARFCLPLALCEPQNRKSHAPDWVHSKKRRDLYTCMVAQHAPRGEPLGGRPLILCIRFSSVGDWKRVLGPSVLGKGKNVGGRRPTAVFMDPPYDLDARDEYLYGEDERGISANVREWCLEHGDDPDLRICLAGYWAEHADHMPSSWTAHRWKGARGYAGEDNDNREQETLWFSPHCLPTEQQRDLFSNLEVGT